MAKRPTRKTAAIAADKLENLTLDKMTAAQFLQALQANEVYEIVHWTEKKKYELEVEPTVLGRMRFRDFVDVVKHIKGEKKKAERELPPGFTPEPVPWRPGLETRLDQLADKLNALSSKIDAISGR